jgi:LysR family nitrogen assimilation transcriptional regulator
MDIKQLRYFLAIVDAGSISKAAEILFVAQPSLSYQIASLEGDLGVALLLRSPLGVIPTEAGKSLYRRAQQVVRQMDQIRQDVREKNRSESGNVAIGFPTTIASVLAVPLFQRVRKMYPGIHLQFFESMSGYITELLANGRLDLALLFRDSPTRGISLHPLFDESLYVLGDAIPGLPAVFDPIDRVCPLRLLSGVPLVVPSAANGLRLLVERTFSAAELDLNIVADIDSLPTLISIAISGAAVTILPASALARIDVPVRPTMRRLIEPNVRRPASLCWSNTVPWAPATQAVKDVMIELLAELHGDGIWPGISLRDAQKSVPDASADHLTDPTSDEPGPL